MTMNYSELVSELTQQIPNLSKLLAKRLINRAYHDILNTKRWSFLSDEGVLFSPSLINTGTITTTQFSKNFTIDSTAQTIWDALANPLVTKRQLKISSGNTFYSISTYNAGAGTLDRIFRETSVINGSYSMFRAYYGLPENSDGTEVTDFLRYTSIYNYTNSYAFNNIYGSREELNLVDPQRGDNGLPSFMYPYKADSNGNPMFEFYPTPLSEFVFIVNYQRKGIDLTTSNTIPNSISEDLLMERALYHGCKWAMKNSGVYPNLKSINWAVISTQHNQEYQYLLNESQRNDDEMVNDWDLVEPNKVNRAIGDAEKSSYYSIDIG